MCASLLKLCFQISSIRFVIQSSHLAFLVLCICCNQQKLTYFPIQQLLKALKSYYAEKLQERVAGVAQKLVHSEMLAVSEVEDLSVGPIDLSY